MTEHDNSYDTDSALADLRRIAAWLAEDTCNDEAQGAAADLLHVADWFATGQFE